MQTTAKRSYCHFVIFTKFSAMKWRKPAARVKRELKNGIAGMRGDDDFWNLETEPLWLTKQKTNTSAKRRYSFPLGDNFG